MFKWFTTAHAQARLEKSGRNELEEKKTGHCFRKIAQFKDVMVPDINCSQHFIRRYG
jgi:hypothetical protein